MYIYVGQTKCKSKTKNNKESTMINKKSNIS